MQHESLVSEINHLVGALRSYAAVAVDLQKNIGKPVEALMQGMLSEIEGLNLVNTNLQTNNSEAIDLADAARGVAIQVTTNASCAKWRKTFSMMQGKDMLGTAAGQYREVRVIGFCKSGITGDKFVSGAVLKVESFTGYLEKVPSLKLHELDRIVTHLRASFDFSRLHPLHDKHCWETVFRHLNRDALRHPARLEGSVQLQAQAFQEIKVLIFGGAIKGVKAKPLLNYSDPEYKNILSDVDLALGQMLAMINGLTRTGSQCFCRKERAEFEAIRLRIIKRINRFNSDMGFAHLPDIAYMV